MSIFKPGMEFPSINPIVQQLIVSSSTVNSAITSKLNENLVQTWARFCDILGKPNKTVDKVQIKGYIPSKACDALKCFKRENLKKCVQCGKVSYCSKECQKSDWKSRHKAMCKAGSAIESIQPKT